MHVTTANSGSRCLQILKDEGQRFHLIFMDHMMPELDGIDTLRLIRNTDDPYFKNVPVIALTANAVSGVQDMFMKEGFQGYVSKPIELAQLEKALKNNLPEDLIIKKQVAAAVTTPKAGEGEMQLRGVDCARGLLNCGNNLDNYLSLLKVVYEDGVVKLDRIRELAEQKNYNEYGIEVHALKSVAASIGAQELSDQAKEHEFANYDGHFDFIDANYQDLLVNYSSLLDDIAIELKARGVMNTVDKTENDGQPKPEIPEETFRQALVEMRRSVEDFDADEAMEKLDWILGFEVGEQRTLALRRIRNLLNDFQYDDAVSAIDKILEL
jgi:CheY-like chemotaxis protein